MKFKQSTLVLAAFALAGQTAAQPVLDGSIAGDSYHLKSIQTVQTEFGDNLSELNAAYARVDAGVLYLTITGSVETNFNKLNIFIDSVAGGQNQIGPSADNGGTNPINDGWADNYSGVGAGGSGSGPGFTFDAGFEADYLFILRNGSFGGDKFDIDLATIGGGLAAWEEAADIFGGTFTGVNADVLPAAGVGVGYDNSNAAGIAGGTAAADPAAATAVQTGIELAIPLSAIGSPTGNIRVSAHINGSNHDFLSNQSLGGFQPDQGNLGGDGGATFTGDVAGIDLNQFAGNQFFVIATRGDANGDTAISNSDLQVSISNFTGPSGSGKLASDGDTDDDGDVDNSDLQFSIANFTGPNPGVPVPEPTSLALVALGGLALVRRRRVG